VDRQGNTEKTSISQGLFGGDFRLSSDGKHLAYRVEGIDGVDLWVHDFDRGVATRLTHGGDNDDPIWLPDSKSLFYTSATPEGSQLVWQPIDGGPTTSQLPAELSSARPRGYVSERQELFLERNDWLYTTSVMNDQNLPAKAELVESVPFPDMAFPSLSPEGRWLAYTTFGTSRYEVFVSSFPDMLQRTQISVSGGEEPRWRRDGGEVVFRWESKWFSVDIDAGAEIDVGPPRPLFEGPYVNLLGFEWDIAPDGQRFLVIENPEQDRPKTELTVVTNFFDEIERLLPSDN
jgi:Tol biopolymer transport system component